MIAFLAADPRNWIIVLSALLVVGIFTLVVKLVNWMVKVHGSTPETDSKNNGLEFEG